MNGGSRGWYYEICVILNSRSDNLGITHKRWYFYWIKDAYLTKKLRKTRRLSNTKDIHVFYWIDNVVHKLNKKRYLEVRALKNGYMVKEFSMDK